MRFSHTIAIFLLIPLFTSCTGTNFLINGIFKSSGTVSLTGDHGQFFIEDGSTQIKFDYGVIGVKKPQMTFSQNHRVLGTITLPSNFFKNNVINAPAESTGQHFDIVGRAYDVLDRTYQTRVDGVSCVSGSHLVPFMTTDADGNMSTTWMPVNDYGVRWEQREYTESHRVVDTQFIDPTTIKAVAHFSGVVGNTKVNYQILAAGPCY